MLSAESKLTPVGLHILLLVGAKSPESQPPLLPGAAPVSVVRLGWPSSWTASMPLVMPPERSNTTTRLSAVSATNRRLLVASYVTPSGAQSLFAVGVTKRHSP